MPDSTEIDVTELDVFCSYVEDGVICGVPATSVVDNEIGRIMFYRCDEHEGICLDGTTGTIRQQVPQPPDYHVVLGQFVGQYREA